jgi:proteasome alpha subunit
MQFYASPEQIMRDRSEYARKGIARGRSVVVLTYEGGVLFVAENLSNALHKVSEIYDRIGFAAVGRYNEFENVRVAGIRMADLRGYSYDRRDVTGWALASAYTQMLGAIFMTETKPFEVEICVAEVGPTPERDELYTITYDGSVRDEPGVVAMGGQADTIAGMLRERHRGEMSMEEALRLAVEALASVGGEAGAPRTLTAAQLEVAILDRRRAGRTFRRITEAAVTGLLVPAATEEPATEAAATEAPAGETPPGEAPPGEAPAAEAPAAEAPAGDTPEAKAEPETETKRSNDEKPAASSAGSDETPSATAGEDEVE